MRPSVSSRAPEAFNKFNDFIELCDKEIERGHLTSYPRKFDFAKENGLVTIDQVHCWMSDTRINFEKATIKLSEELK